MQQLEVHDLNIFEQIPERLAREFLRDVERFYMQQAVDRLSNRGAIFVVNTNGDSLLREANAMDNPAFESFSKDWMKVVLFNMYVIPYSDEPDIIDMSETLQSYVDTLAVMSFEDLHVDMLLKDVVPQQMSDALHTFAGDICLALRVLRLPFIMINDPICVEHNSFTFVPNMHQSSYETFNEPLYYVYPKMKMYTSQREVW